MDILARTYKRKILVARGTMATITVNRIQQFKRRSNRMAECQDWGVGEEGQKCSFTMAARATSLNRHGAAA